ncbi:6-phosphogluconolactonase [Alteromonas lipolytica]|uniref:6-phosphogluconolactonase n=1 Tax=Alteromonas lipolytica TaxID=1856405 RepID=A0A1E8FGE1_9ALTE|nr:6-phosphogluconolactonase [Alteromonas lipolytica]OFI35001.1 6-phosphogluconolactonase [Alteromonas lipolytica]GGF55771.1 6-phosphogluconolactonase [Alteromonas lipolytica]
MPLTQSIYESAEALNTEFAAEIAGKLATGIAERGRASLMVSGGRTPLPLFKALSHADIDWSKVDVSLVDERWVDESSDASNTRLVKDNLLVNNAAAARFIEMKSAEADAADAVIACEARLAAMSQPFDVLILGMGEDGHTASLFPCSEQLAAGLQMDSGRVCIATQPTTAPHQRMSLTLPAIVASRNIYLHLTGDKKRQVLEDAVANATATEKPIVAVINAAQVTLKWAP